MRYIWATIENRLVKLKSKKFSRKIKPLMVIMFLVALGLLDVMLLGNPNDVVFCDFEITEAEGECENELMEQFEVEFLVPDKVEIARPNKDLREKEHMIVPFDTLYLGNIPSEPPDQILLFI